MKLDDTSRSQVCAIPSRAYRKYTGSLERDDGVDACGQLVVGVAAIERQAGRAGQSVVPVITQFGPYDEIAVGVPIEARGDVVEIAGKASS